MEAYDPNVCYLDFWEDDYLFILERSKGNCDASDNQRCSWDLENQTRVPGAIPSNFSGPLTYYCDGNYRPLAWGEYDRNNNGTNDVTNGYRCVCGGPMENYLTVGRTNRPWKGAFGKQCNLITDFSFHKGDFGSVYDSSQGVCVTVAAESNDAALAVNGTFAFPNDGLTLIDRYGIVYFCINEVVRQTGKHLDQACNCDGPLPETVFGQQLSSEQRNRCGFESAKERNGIIVGSVVGSVAAIAFAVALLMVLYLHRRKKSRFSRPTQAAEQDSVDSGVELMDKSAQQV